MNRSPDGADGDHRLRDRPLRRSSPARAFGLVALGSAVAARSLGSCGGTPNTAFQLSVPSALAPDVAWYEVGVFPGGCPSSGLLEGGIPGEGTVAHLAFAASASPTPGLGLLASGHYGLAAVARAADCSVLATGCSAVSVSGSSPLSVTLSAISGTSVGACTPGSTCDEAACVPSPSASTTADASVTLLSGACTLQLVGAGPLADPLTEGTTLLSSPAIAATPDGFLLAYREFDSSGGTARLTTIALGPSGAAASPLQTTLPGTCARSPETDATALVFSGSEGTIALSRPVCAAGDGGADAGAAPGGVDVLSVDASGNVGQSSFSSQPGLTITLARAHALAVTPFGTLLAFTEGASGSKQSSFAATLAGVDVASSPAPVAYSTLTGFSSVTAAFVTGSSYGAGFLALGSGGTVAPDASAEGGSPSGAAASLVTRGSDAGAPAKGSAFPAAWGSLGATGSRVLVATNGESNGNSIAWTAFDMGTRAPATSGGFAPASNGAVAFADVALVGDLAFFAAEVDQDISLFAFDKASTIPLYLEEIPFSQNPVIPLGALRDGLVAVAASSTRVAVVWGTGMTLGSDDDVGGYAVFGCAP